MIHSLKSLKGVEERKKRRKKKKLSRNKIVFDHFVKALWKFRNSKRSQRKLNIEVREINILNITANLSW